MDPYRFSQQSGTCPRCQNETAADGELNRLSCVRGCGEWYPKSTLDQHIPWHEIEQKPAGIGPDGLRPAATSWPWGPASCPVCQRPMATGFRGEVRFDYCSQHGVWLDAGEFHRFAQAFQLS